LCTAALVLIPLTQVEMGRFDWRRVVTAACGIATGIAITGLAWRVDALERSREVAQLHRALVDLLLNTLNAGDAVTERHSRRVADLTDLIAGRCAFPEDERATLRLAALLHDMGKIDDRFFHILHGCQPLSEEDRASIRTHPGQSADILEPLEAIHPGISAIVAAHHESWDGSGYPRGAQGTEIPLASRIISVADVFDALTQPRAYREPLSPEDALSEIKRGSGSRFDPAIVDLLRSPGLIDEWLEVMARGRSEENLARSRDGQGVEQTTSVRPPKRSRERGRSDLS